MPQWSQGQLGETLLFLAGLLGAAFVVDLLTRWVVVRGGRALARRSSTTWDDALFDAHVFQRVAHLAPTVVVYLGIPLIPGVPEGLDAFVRRASVATMVVLGAAVLSALLSAADAIYSSREENRRRPIKSYVQLVQIGVFVLAALIALSALLGRSPWIFVSGIGAMTAVLMLIFKDTILSLVASVQIASNDMLRVGDWIEMADAGADGDVIDIALHTVKVQNWDKTIVAIPTYRFISAAFKNWRGMADSGGRRIKRSIHIDLNSVRFLTDEEIARFRDWALLRDYITAKQDEIERFNAQPGRNARINADIRRMTNLGTLRAYIEAYLRAHPKIHEEGYTLIVRQLQPGPHGLPIEIYCFSNDQEWARYEGIQADLFDHILAMVPEFGLQLYQQPAGVDFERLPRPATAGPVTAQES